MAKKKRRVDLKDGAREFGENPFGTLESEGLPHRPVATPVPEKTPNSVGSGKSRGRVDVVRQRSAGSGGWMTVAKNFIGISIEEKNTLKKTIQKRCGVGGTLKNGAIEIQGDKREQVREVLESAGFRVVYAGG